MKLSEAFKITEANQLKQLKRFNGFLGSSDDKDETTWCYEPADRSSAYAIKWFEGKLLTVGDEEHRYPGPQIRFGWSLLERTESSDYIGVYGFGEIFKGGKRVSITIDPSSDGFNSYEKLHAALRDLIQNYDLTPVDSLQKPLEVAKEIYDQEKNVDLIKKL